MVWGYRHTGDTIMGATIIMTARVTVAVMVAVTVARDSSVLVAAGRYHQLPSAAAPPKRRFR